MENLAKHIHNEVYKKYIESKTSIFLCGATNTNTDSVRKKIEIGLSSFWYYKNRHQIIYPEEIFESILFGEERKDLISLENILAESVDVIVLVIESWGAVAELGIFSSHDQLRKKLICLIDEKYKKDKSFINYGPVRLMKDKKEGKVIYLDFENINSTSLSNIFSAAEKIKRETPKTTGVINLVQAPLFILSCIYLLEPVMFEFLVELVQYSSESDKDFAKVITEVAIATLTKNGEVESTQNGFMLTSIGEIAFKSLNERGNSRYNFDLKAMDDIRIRILNWKLRRKNLQFPTN